MYNKDAAITDASAYHAAMVPEPSTAMVASPTSDTRASSVRRRLRAAFAAGVGGGVVAGRSTLCGRSW